MTYKTVEVKHEYVVGTIELLNGHVSNRRTEGWTLLEAKLVHFDLMNQDFAVFYIWEISSK